ncbi:MFS transporter [Planctomonas psychrotolerans]|uniref:MFS transporter n=1 Tax=Planctomonas psychrotolerans TaxID=2528712 RepID=UPI00123A5D65|nr:MFS transporter [Planctomonas psychrotolerans]
MTAVTGGLVGDPLVRTFVAWTFVRAILHNGWWLLVSLYMVIDVGLSPSELLLIAAAQGTAAVLFELPAGVLADAFSRKWAIVLSHALMGMAMISTGLFPSFAPLMLSQMLWGISWTFSSGSDIAWITDELQLPDRMHHVLTRQARWQLAGAGVGMVALGTLGALIDRATVIVAAGVAMLLLGLVVAWLFPERNFMSIRTQRCRGSLRILRHGVRLAFRDKTILVLVIVTMLVNGAADSFGRIYPVKLVDVGLPEGNEGTAWFTGISIAGFVTGALTLRIIENRIHSETGARGVMVLGGISGAISLALFGFAPDMQMAIVAVLVANGVAGPIFRTVTTIWVNRRTTKEVRATTHSLLAQAEYVGEIATAGVLAVIAGLAGPVGAFVLTAALFGVSAVVVLLAGRDQDI